MILIAMDSWKGSLTALEAGHAVARGLLRACPDLDLHVCGLADGGEGTLDIVAESRPGTLRSLTVTGPLPDRQVNDGYLYWEETREALVEMAKCSGLPLLQPEERNPMLTTTRGVGEWILDAKQHGCERLTLALGGSATVDGGTGMARALGWRFLDADGRELPDGGGALIHLHTIIPPLDPLGIEVRAMCDVTNPLLGEKSAAKVFGPQKGATPEQVKLLDEGLGRLAECLKRDVGCDVSTVPGGGAAGGMGAATLGFLQGELVSGIQEMIRISGLEDQIRAADHVITGEGRVDSQSLDGKVLSGMLDLARPAGVPVSVLAGSCLLEAEALTAAGLTFAVSANDGSHTLEEAMKHASTLAEAAGYKIGVLLKEMNSNHSPT